MQGPPGSYPGGQYPSQRPIQQQQQPGMVPSQRPPTTTVSQQTPFPQQQQQQYQPPAFQGYPQQQQPPVAQMQQMNLQGGPPRPLTSNVNNNTTRPGPPPPSQQPFPSSAQYASAPPPQQQQRHPSTTMPGPPPPSMRPVMQPITVSTANINAAAAAAPGSFPPPQRPGMPGPSIQQQQQQPRPPAPFQQQQQQQRYSGNMMPQPSTIQQPQHLRPPAAAAGAFRPPPSLQQQQQQQPGGVFQTPIKPPAINTAFPSQQPQQQQTSFPPPSNNNTGTTITNQGVPPPSPPPFTLQVSSPSPNRSGAPGSMHAAAMHPGGGLGGGGGIRPPPPPPSLVPPPGGFTGMNPNPWGMSGGGGPPPPTSQQQQQQQQQQYPPSMQQVPSVGPSIGGVGYQYGAQAPGFGGTVHQQHGPPMQQGLPSPTKGIDPSQIPRPSPPSLPTQVFETRIENTHAIPPPADAPMVVRDLGSAPPRYMRSSVNMVPQSGDLLKSAALPFVVIVSPLAAAEPGDDVVPVVEFGGGSSDGGGGPVRCAACKAYMNPYMRFVDGGRRFECNFCGKISDTPSEYFCPLGVDGFRQDRLQRPELCKGSVDVVATKEYMVRPPMPPVHFFLIETTPQALASGATAAACSSISKLLDDIDESAGGGIAQVCIATFDTTIHYYSIRPGQSRPQMLIIPDVMDPYAPLSGNVIVKLRQSKQLLQKLLGSIPATMAADPAQGESCGGAAIKSAVDALKGGVGGRLRVFTCTLPRRGVMQLRPRDSGRAPSDKDPLENMAPANKDWASLAADAADHQICIDLFLLTSTQPQQHSLDVASLGVLSTATCGQLYYYAPFHPAVDADQFYNDLRWNLLRPQGYEAVGRLRVSDGLAVDAAFGSFHRRTVTDMNFPAISCDQSVAIRINYEGRLPEHGEASLQYALLYTTSDGQRRIRVHTLALPVTKSLGTVFRGADLDCFLGYLSRKVAGQIPNHSLGACKETMNRAAADALLAYRRHCASASSSGQLILPEALKLLPLYTLALTKLPCFRTEARPDIRAVWMFRLQSMTANKVVPSLYPRLVPVHRLLEQQEYQQQQQANGIQQQQSKPVKVPDKLWLSAEKLEPDGVYLLENGFECWLYFGKSVGPDVYSSLLGAPSLEAAAAAGPGPDRPLVLPRLDTPLSRAVNALLDEVRRQRGGYMRLRIPKRGGGDAEETAFFAALLEDRSMAGASYVEYLCWLHRQIQNKVT